MTARPPIAQFGDAIEVKGVRPAWLPDDAWDHLSAKLYDGRTQFPCIDTDPRMGDWQWHVIESIALEVPRYDFVYLALEQGMVPWFGGDEAPGDWDGGEVLMRADVMFDMECFAGNDFMWRHDTGSDDIIGYQATSTALPLAQPAAVEVGEVNQADREAAAKLYEMFPELSSSRDAGLKTAQFIRDGGGDGWNTVRSYRDHRLAALAPAAIASGRGEG